MAQGKQTPRQKMINLMYLVFIAMLAMQIDQEIVRSFYDTQVSLSETLSLTNSKNEVFEKNLAEKAQNSPDDQVSYQNYLELKGYSDDLVNDINRIKNTMVTQSGFKFNEENFDYNSLNNAEHSTKLFFQGGDENKPSGEAKSLINKINALRGFIIQKFEGDEKFSTVVSRAKQNLITEYPKKKNGKSWLMHKFYNQPLVAALSNLEILATEVRNIQSDALSIYLQGKSIIADPNSTLITQTPTTSPPMTSNSSHTEDFTQQKTQDYTATITSGTVLYQGFPNPVNIDGATSSTSISATGATVSGGGGKWTVTPGPVDEVTLTVGGKSTKYMVKKLPPVVATVRGKSAVAMPASSIKNQTVSVDMPGFVYPVSFTVNGFKVKVPGKPTAFVSGNSLSEVGHLFTNLRAGDKVTILDIEVTATGMGNSIPKTPSNVTINVSN
ncbi:GldM family protein [Chryseobacterium taklimakanense]|uniref:GldM family protein n=1 Tax=Chryseobacterium taklimakanense TaxID=536441 RepID=UPI0023F84B5C|nr:GldM family protein [Chryseobacterium taklimakanense]